MLDALVALLNSVCATGQHLMLNRFTQFFLDRTRVGRQPISLHPLWNFISYLSGPDKEGFCAFHIACFAQAYIYFGFRSGTLDLSDGSTPPDVLVQFGFDESWTGLYLPEIRLFIAPNGAQDFAIDAGVENLLIGIGVSSGITGDFSLQVLDQGTGPMRLGARFYDADQRGYGLVRTSDTMGTVALPERSRMVVDIEGGRTPITTTVTVQGSPAQNNRVIDIDLSSAAERTITINVTDSSSPQRTGTLTIAATRRPAPIVIPGVTSLGLVPAAVLTTTLITQGLASPQQPRLVLVSETPNTATIALDVPPARQAQTQWTINGTPRGTSATLTVDLPPGSDATIQAELPGETAIGNFTGYFRFDQPPYRVGDRVQTDADTQNFAQQPDRGQPRQRMKVQPPIGWVAVKCDQRCFLYCKDCRRVLRSWWKDSQVTKDRHLSIPTTPSEFITKTWRGDGRWDYGS